MQNPQRACLVVQAFGDLARHFVSIGISCIDLLRPGPQRLDFGDLVIFERRTRAANQRIPYVWLGRTLRLGIALNNLNSKRLFPLKRGLTVEMLIALCVCDIDGTRD